MKKLQTELSNDELFDLLQNNEESSKPALKNKYLNFISKYNIQSGTSEVPTSILLELFKFDYPKISSQAFVINMKKYIEWETHRNRTIFFINKSLLEISKSLDDLINPPSKPKKVRDRKKHIEDYLKYFNLKPGNNSIEPSILFDLYDRWCYKYKRKRITHKEFYAYLKLYLPLVNEKYHNVHDDLFKIISLKTIKGIKRKREEWIKRKNQDAEK